MKIWINEDPSLSQLEDNGLRHFQNTVLNQSKEGNDGVAPIHVINAMTGSGKSIAAQTVALYRLAKKQIQKVIIAVPQKSIGINFRKYPVKGFEYADQYHVSLDLIDTLDTTQKLGKFLDSGKGICICTHSTLTSLMPSSEDLSDCLLIIDEAHHVDASEDEMNQLGICATNSMESKGHTILMTATPFRTDAAKVVPDGFDYVSSFFSITDFLASCKYLRGLSIEFDLHDKDSYLERIHQVDFSRKTVLYIPVTESYEVRDLFDKHSKKGHINELIAQIGTRKGIDENGFYLVERNGKLLRIADLVNDDGKHQKALDNTRATSDCDVVIAMSKAKEGWDYPCIEQVVIVGARGSLSDTLQMIGRGIRDFPNKENCYVKILTQVVDLDSEDIREQTSRFLKTIYCAQLLEDIMVPANVFKLKKVKNEKGENEILFPKVKAAIDDGAISAKIGEAIRALPISIQLSSKSVIKSALQKIIKNELPHLSIIELHQFLRAFKTLQFLRSEVKRKDLSLQFAGTIDLNNVEYSVIDEMNVINDSISILAKSMGVDSFLALKNALVKEFYETLKEASIAARKLGSKTFTDYNERYKEDPKLPSHPKKIYKGQYEGEWSWRKFLGQEHKEFYPTIKEASDAARKLGSKKFRDYIKLYKEDPKLPSEPQSFYSSQYEGAFSWKKFLGNNFYETIKEASTAAQKRGFKTGTDYRGRYKEDPKLPSEPRKTYKGQYEGKFSWKIFFGQEHEEFYPTIKEASNAALKRGFKTSSEYDKRYKEDPKLPSNPKLTYKGQYEGKFSWDKFLGREDRTNYETIKEASIAAQKLGAKTSSEYAKRYKEDPKLPSSVYRTYKGQYEGKFSFLKFLGQEHKEFYPTIKEASIASLKIEIKTSSEYAKRYKEDPKLPSTPGLTYKGQYEGAFSFLKFLGKE